MELNIVKASVTVIGCGWLGLPLCEALASQGQLAATTSSQPEKIVRLSHQFTILPFDIKTEAPNEDLLMSDVIVYTIPPLGLGEVERFFKKIDPHKKIIFISSISIYGKFLGDCNEETLPIPESKNGKLLIQSESFLRAHFKKLTILRPGGLFGQFDEVLRHPINSLQGKKNLTNGSEWLHLVDGHDCLFAIKKIIKDNIWNEDFNLVNDVRVRKSEYYPQIANKLGLTAPQYVDQNEITPTSNHTLNHTKISNEKSKKYLSLIYHNS
jgi:nucleoside-diphosphate-sugar epimerase